ncbi:MAG TPA: F0F1 ATP synthase subunit delta [Candidatus Limnocylindrales bacterium]|jgi:F-type H+-transporting ATPase subunit delta|nr:F0F1 ATP synthase subunit delta [Candidatus Limnocylindrales bacterium]
MPRPTTAARRYAEAAFELASRHETHDRWDSDLRTAAELLADERVARVVDNPAIPLVDREAVLKRLLGRRLARPAFNLVRLLARRGRIDIVPAVAAQFGRLLDDSRGIVAATVSSAAPLDEDEEAAVRSRVEAMTGREVRLTTAVDPDLIGGLVVRVGDQWMDASVRGRLERLRNQLVAGTQNR